MTTFGQRLRQSMAARGPVCAGIDPHAGLLRQWGLEDSPAGVREFSDLPAEARTYVTRIEELARTRVSAIGVGPGREATITRHRLLG